MLVKRGGDQFVLVRPSSLRVVQAADTWRDPELLLSRSAEVCRLGPVVVDAMGQGRRDFDTVVRIVQRGCDLCHAGPGAGVVTPSAADRVDGHIRVGNQHVPLQVGQRGVASSASVDLPVARRTCPVGGHESADRRYRAG